MKAIKVFAFVLFAFAISVQAKAATETKNTAETIFAFVGNMETIDAELLKAEIETLTLSEKVKLAEMAIEDVKVAQAAGLKEPSVGMYILAIFIPPVAVGLHTNWDMPTVWNVVWCFLGYVPGIIHAFIVLGR